MISAISQPFVIIDGHSIVHRAYHALPVLTTKQGLLVNAVYGFFLIFLKAIKGLEPGFLAVAFDVPGPTFRHSEFADYKANRKKTPDDLCRQIPEIKAVLQAFGVKVFEKQGFEADDIIGTIVKEAKKTEVKEIIILSSDTDFLQLVGDKVKVMIIKRGLSDIIIYDEKQVQQKYGGLKPSQLIDFKALKGDVSDNIPGVSGIGEKTAIKLISDFGGLDNLYLRLKNKQDFSLVKPAVLNKLLHEEGKALLSRNLVKVKENVDIDFELALCAWAGYDRPKVEDSFKNLGFVSLLSKLSDN